MPMVAASCGAVYATIRYDNGRTKTVDYAKAAIESSDNDDADYVGFDPDSSYPVSHPCYDAQRRAKHKHVQREQLESELPDEFTADGKRHRAELNDIGDSRYDPALMNEEQIESLLNMDDDRQIVWQTITRFEKNGWTLKPRMEVLNGRRQPFKVKRAVDSALPHWRVADASPPIAPLPPVAECRKPLRLDALERFINHLIQGAKLRLGRRDSLVTA
jgi:hypothetical protein